MNKALKKSTLAMAMTLGFTAMTAAAMAAPRDYREGYRDGAQGRAYHNSHGYKNSHPDRADYLFRVLDRNDNGRISHKEYVRQYGHSRQTQRNFARLDRNNDGVLSQWELRSGSRMASR